jgi:hypothetical protein
MMQGTYDNDEQPQDPTTMATTTTLNNATAATSSPPGPSTDKQMGPNDIVIWAPGMFLLFCFY